MVDTNSSQTETMKHLTDILSTSTMVGTILGALPGIAALFTIVWTAIRIYETATVQKLIKQWRRNV